MAWVMLVLKSLSWLVSLVLTTLALKLTPSSMGVSLQGADRCQLSVMEQATCRCSVKDRLDASIECQRVFVS